MKDYVDDENVQRVIEGYKKRIRHRYDPVYYHNRALMCHRIGLKNYLFDDIVVEGEENVKKVEDKQLLYVSNHVSLADFCVQGYIFWRDKLPIPRFIAGENLNKLIFKNFWKKCGAISVDRRGRSRLYWRIYKEEVEKVLLNKESLLLYPEGTRTDTLSKLKTGTFGPIVGAIEKRMEIYGLPIFMEYDNRIEKKVIDKVRMEKEKRDALLKKEDDLKREGRIFLSKIYGLIAKRKDKFSFNLDFAAYLIRPFTKNKGNAYLNFGEPFFINEYLEERGNKGSNGKKGKILLTEKIEKELRKVEERFRKL